MDRDKLKAWVAALVVLIAGCVVSWMFVAPFLRGPNRFVVHNATGLDLAEIHVLLWQMDGRPALDTTVLRLAAGSSATFTHELNDSGASIEFHFAGKLRRFTTGYIDLWRGEGWVLEIQPDGSVKQGYDDPGFELQRESNPR